QSASSPEVARASSPLTRLAPGASDNFGIPQGEDCFPLFSGIIRIMNKDCQKKTETRTWQTWGTQINNALIGGQIDLVKAARETCRLGAERQMCTVLGEQIARCDIIGSLQNAVELQRQTQRCEQVTAFADLPRQQNTGGLIGSLNNLINGEVSGGLLQNFFG
uniref:Uncharacterized protein n=2 Tax=Plectus sambesii TaxID=2011161 RepID=A0A914XJG9_9BILA